MPSAKWLLPSALLQANAEWITDSNYLNGKQKLAIGGEGGAGVCRGCSYLGVKELERRVPANKKIAWQAYSVLRHKCVSSAWASAIAELNKHRKDTNAQIQIHLPRAQLPVLCAYIYVFIYSAFGV